MISLETVLIAQAAFALGYLCGRVGGFSHSQKEAPQGFFAQNTVAKRKVEPQAQSAARPDIEIDDRKIVSQINTDTMQKVTQIELGTKTAVADDINVSVNKLAQLKGK